MDIHQERYEAYHRRRIHEEEQEVRSRLPDVKEKGSSVENSKEPEPEYDYPGTGCLIGVLFLV